MPCQARSALFICEDIATADHADAFGQFAALPPAIKQGRNAAGHNDRHIGNDPISRIARGDPDPVALLKFVPVD